MPDVYERDLDLNLLRVFAVAAEEGSITRAASRLYITQPAVSAAMRRLTSLVGVELIARQGRGIVLASRGAELNRSDRFDGGSAATNVLFAAEPEYFSRERSHGRAPRLKEG
jgi:Bacterial regulatory helix-turn-helix protein, lysR family